ncbi:unnamed protein product [Callosobruchus maculatus]|uniref:Uncharacterized protein n=1 Tax=Callosobruchus maculatus TaxID=64391 RepID=A0A653DNB5_CALMS|nr:unnamed protein product [Callosobruchus maculatus]
MGSLETPVLQLVTRAANIKGPAVTISF